MSCNLLVGTLGLGWVVALVLLFARWEHLIPDPRFADRRRDLRLLGRMLAVLLSWLIVFHGIVLLYTRFCG